MSKSLAISGDAARRGRRTRLLEKSVMQRVVEATRAGLTASATADYAGISRSTFFDWMRRGRQASDAFDAGDLVADSELPFLEFLDEIRRIKAVTEVGILAVIEDSAARGNWRAAAWLLERSRPETWGPPPRRVAPVEPDPRVDPAELERKVMQVLRNRGDVPSEP
jgi:transposase